MKKLLTLLIVCCAFVGSTLTAKAQGLMGHKHDFTKADTLRGTLSPVRTWFDVTYYDLNIKLDPEKRTISGYNDIHFKVLEKNKVMQIDLFENLAVDKIEFDKKELTYKREHHAVFINIDEDLPIGSQQVLRFHYSGEPTTAVRAPWDGGFVWNKDNNDKHFIGVACQGFGASSWWPNKDHQSEEPDSMRISCAVPNGLTCVANGQNEGTTEEEGDYTRHHWFVSYPINNYAVSMTIADFTYFSDIHVSGKDTLALNYYVLPYNLEKAKKQFEQVKPMMKCYEEFLGRFPFWEDGFALVETPYLGMEHQSGIAYGNKYKTGYNGMDFSGIGLDFDYIIIHEAGHEWWGNSLTTADIADMWIHEGFCTYTEALYVECLHGYEKAMDYVNAKKRTVANDKPIIGHYGVNKEGSGDMYNKGMLILNTVRHLIDNDELWFEILMGLTQDFEHQVVTSKQVTDYINEKSGKDFNKVWKQYLTYKDLPTLEYKTKKAGKKNTKVSYRWKADVAGFDMPLQYIDKKGNKQWIMPTTEWQTMTVKGVKVKDFVFNNRQFYYSMELKK